MELLQFAEKRTAQCRLALPFLQTEIMTLWVQPFGALL
jgi:hypothetical protein